jgi:Xaa-Pro aminopeptidase
MSKDEQDLLRELHLLHAAQERLNRKIADATQRQRHSKEPEEIADAERAEQHLLAEMNRLMDRLRAVEGQILQIRRTGRRRFE